MFKNILNIVMELVFQPNKAWDILYKRRDKEEKEFYLVRFIYPLLGLLVLVSFLSVLITEKDFQIANALKKSIYTIVWSFGSFYAASYLLNEIGLGVFHRAKDQELNRQFVAYAWSPVIMIEILLSLFPRFFFLQIFELYICYIIWWGASSFMHVKEEQRTKYVIIASLIMLLLPVFIRRFIEVLMPNL